MWNVLITWSGLSWGVSSWLSLFPLWLKIINRGRLMGNYRPSHQYIWRQTSISAQRERCTLWWIILTQWCDILYGWYMQVYESDMYLTSFCPHPPPPPSLSQGIEITSTGSSNHYVTGTAAEVRLSHSLSFIHRWLTNHTELTITAISGL